MSHIIKGIDRRIEKFTSKKRTQKQNRSNIHSVKLDPLNYTPTLPLHSHPLNPMDKYKKKPTTNSLI